MKKSYLVVAAVLLSQATPAFSQEGAFVDGFDDGVLSETRYNVRATNDSSSIIVDNGMLRLQATTEDTPSARASLDFAEQTNFIQADITLDSASMADEVGMSRIMLSAALYNDIRPFGVEDGGSIGDVLAQLSVRVRGDGTLSTLVCAFRSDDDDFGSITTIAIADFPECGQFDTEIQFDVPYRASIFIDQTNRKLVFKLDDAVIDHTITGNIFEPSSRAAASVVALANGSGTAVGLADNITNSITAVVPDNSTTDDSTDDTTTDDTTGDSTMDETTDDTTDDSTTMRRLTIQPRMRRPTRRPRTTRQAIQPQTT